MFIVLHAVGSGRPVLINLDRVSHIEPTLYPDGRPAGGSFLLVDWRPICVTEDLEDLAGALNVVDELYGRVVGEDEGEDGRHDKGGGTQ